MECKCQSKSSFSSLAHFSSHNHTYLLSLPTEHNPPNPLQQDSPVPHMRHKQTLQQPAPGLSGTQWFEELFHSKQQDIPLLILTFDSSGLTPPPFVEPFGND
ncbi:hypothetical protein O181_014655 [Austropuccinia psidii MF-1]|uniref:Uncharacterized protein n=1 Tax=Austropuccinia psidii MF-1 TaxID=1389203 RepID=A0A9Q3GQ48_9BASI|nr:hypothetical protein [Austropuccinia psidii MF-1]